MLTEAFNQSIQDARVVAHNPYLALMTPAVRLIESVADTVPAVAEYVDALRGRLRQRDFALAEKATNDFLQQLGEAHFLALCAQRGIVLERIPEGATPTPDFALGGPTAQMHFEVKTLSVVGGDRGIAETILDASRAADSIEAQIRSGKRVAIGESFVQPFGAKNSVAEVIDTLFEKIRQNIKIAQYRRPATYLVVDLTMLSTVPGGRSALRPLYPDPHFAGAQISGALWMSAFGKPGTDLFGFSDFEGASNSEGVFQKEGILLDPQFADVRGLIWVSHGWNVPTALWALLRGSDLGAAGNLAPGVIQSLVGEGWNDEVDRNGPALQAKSGGRNNV